ncbi:hypothetical protein [Terrabacter sp. Root181]|uniref:hypothetical protein n=1 Tax=Terrabacter sp. Root181 TaxID=1736484 RepID=UPI0006F51A1A|nr:hypothetical protein [Terrabacter sp. Root181]KRB42993.1 hypothetical protein ASD90_21635 [Terrabacter sp. Root181]
MADPDAQGPRPEKRALPRPSISDKRWAQLGQDLRLRQLRDLRATAEQWRNGLAGLTAIVTVVLIVKGTETVADLSPWARIATGLLVAGALAFLLLGAWSAMEAAFGVPGDAILLSGPELRSWSEEQVRAGVKQLTRARWSFFAGLVLLAAAIGVTWVDAASTADPLLNVHVGSQVFCGAPVESASGEIVLDTAERGGKQQTVLRLRDVTEVEVVGTCD